MASYPTSELGVWWSSTAGSSPVDLGAQLSGRFAVDPLTTIARRRVRGSGVQGMTADGVSAGLLISGRFYAGDWYDTLVEDGYLFIDRGPSCGRAIAMAAVITAAPVIYPADGVTEVNVRWAQSDEYAVEGARVTSGSVTAPSGGAAYAVTSGGAVSRSTSGALTVASGGVGVAGPILVAE